MIFCGWHRKVYKRKHRSRQVKMWSEQICRITDKQSHHRNRSTNTSNPPSLVTTAFSCGRVLASNIAIGYAQALSYLVHSPESTFGFT